MFSTPSTPRCSSLLTMNPPCRREIEPSEGKLYAPADGVIETVFETKHAVGMTTDAGVELLMHIGLTPSSWAASILKPILHRSRRSKRGICWFPSIWMPSRLQAIL
ncbi:MAG: PTS glucose transporter subunit IIA [Fibrobacter sp.]|nr:PTS glucose transporter subunit IIA [Fibrobacter sp.]